MGCILRARVGPGAIGRHLGHQRLIEFGFVPSHGLRGGEKVPAGLHFGKSVQADLARSGMGNRAEFRNHLQDFDVGDQLFIRQRQPALQPPCGVDHDCGPGHQAPPEPELRFVCSLNIGACRGRASGRAPGQPDHPRKLARGKRGAEVFGRSEGGAPGLHIDV